MGIWHGGSQRVAPGPAAAASPGACQSCRFRTPTPDLLNQELEDWGPTVRVLTSPPGDPGASGSVETDVLVDLVPSTLVTGGQLCR